MDDELYITELPDDETLLLLIGSADELAFSSFYARYGRLLYSIALRITGDGQATEEILQDVFHAVWERAAQFRPAAGSVQTWLTSITRNRAIDEVRSRWYRASSNTLSLDALPELGARLERGLEQMAIVRADIRAALNTLPTLQRQAIELSYFGGLSSQEIAQWFGEPVGTIKSRLRTRARKVARRGQQLAGVRLTTRLTDKHRITRCGQDGRSVRQGSTPSVVTTSVSVAIHFAPHSGSQAPCSTVVQCVRGFC